MAKSILDEEGTLLERLQKGMDSVKLFYKSDVRNENNLLDSDCDNLYLNKKQVPPFYVVFCCVCCLSYCFLFDVFIVYLIIANVE